MPPRKRPTSQPLTRQASKRARPDQMADPSSSGSAATFTADQIAAISNAVATAVARTLNNLPPPSACPIPTLAIQFSCPGSSSNRCLSHHDAPNTVTSQCTQDLVQASTGTVIHQLTGNTPPRPPSGDGSTGKTSKNPFMSSNVSLPTEYLKKYGNRFGRMNMSIFRHYLIYRKWRGNMF